MARSSIDARVLDQDLTYDRFRTGLTYKQVYHMIWDRRWKRRPGVLGYWRQLKLEMWTEYQRRLGEVQRDRRAGRSVRRRDGTAAAKRARTSAD